MRLGCRLALIGEKLTAVIGQKAVVFPPFSPAVHLKIETIVRFSLIESVFNKHPPHFALLS